MALNAQELAVLKDLVDKELPAVLNAEILRFVPTAEFALAEGISTAVVPQLIAKLDALLA